MDEVFQHFDSLDEILGRAPRRMPSPHSQSQRSSSDLHTRLFEVIPAENRLSPCMSASSWSESVMSCFEFRALESRQCAGDTCVGNGLSPLQRATGPMLSPSRSLLPVVVSSPVDRAEQFQERGRSSKAPVNQNFGP